MHKVESTYQILASKALKDNINEEWVDWAIEMLMAGYDTEHLRILAGIERPYNQFYLQDLADKVFLELELDWSDTRSILLDYAYYLITEAINKRKSLDLVQEKIYDLYYFKDEWSSDYLHFMFLIWARNDLKYDEYQHYLEGATRENIDQVTLEYFTTWREKYLAERKPTPPATS